MSRHAEVLRHTHKEEERHGREKRHKWIGKVCVAHSTFNMTQIAVARLKCIKKKFTARLHSFGVAFSGCFFHCSRLCVVLCVASIAHFDPYRAARHDNIVVIVPNYPSHALYTTANNGIAMQTIKVPSFVVLSYVTRSAGHCIPHNYISAYY